jgi:ABC exporter DevB family membrane fusion protein
VRVGSELSGTIRSVLVEEGQHVRKGQVLAILANDDYKAQEDASQAQVRQARATYQKVLNGSRAQEREEAKADFDQAEAVASNEQTEFERYRKLWEAGLISREQFESHKRQAAVAEAQMEAARQHFQLIDDHARDEDIAYAKAQLDVAKAQAAYNEAIYAKSLLRSPLDGTVLRVHHQKGESITNFGVTPDPVFTIGDLSAHRVRVDIDETDVSRVSVGQKVYVTADTYPGKRFPGKVVRVSAELGQKTVHSEEPQEKVDTKVLETLIQLDPDVRLPIGLRVDAYIEARP